MTNIPVTSIEWRDQSSQLTMSTAVNLTVLEFMISVVTDDLQGQRFTCIAVAGDTTYTQILEIQVQGMNSNVMVISRKSISLYSPCWLSGGVDRCIRGWSSGGW